MKVSRCIGSAVAIGCLGAVCLTVSSATAAQSSNFTRDCKEWIDKKGYSTDYIEQKIGKRQRGMAPSWRGNVEPVRVQVGDVVITPVRERSEAMRAAYVEEVISNPDGTASAVLVSEWNYGRYRDERCFVTVNFGLQSSARIPVTDIARVWRPSLPL